MRRIRQQAETPGLHLAAAFGSALIPSICGVVDMAMAVVSPIWNIIHSIGLLMGIGGSFLFSTLRGESKESQNRSNEYFTAELKTITVTGTTKPSRN